MDKRERNKKGIKIKYPLRHAYVIAHFMLPFIPIKVLYTDWKYIITKNYLIHNDEKLYKIEFTREVIKGVQYITFSTTQEKFKFPITYAEKPFKLHKILNCTYAFLSRQNFVVIDPEEFVEFAKEKRNEVLDRGISIWIDHYIKGENRHFVRIPRQTNVFWDIINKFNDISLVNDANRPLIGWFIDKKDFLMRNDNNCFVDYIKKHSKNNTKDMLVTKLNVWGDVVEECDNYELIPFRKKTHYEMLPDDLLNFMQMCNYCTYERNQRYVAMCALKNNDIFLIETNNLEFVKRKGKWYNISFENFKYIIQNSFEYLTDKFIRYLYYLTIRACIEDKEFTLQILYPEQYKLFNERILSYFPKDDLIFKDNSKEKEFLNEKLIHQDYEKAYEFITSHEIVSMNDQGRYMSVLTYDAIKGLGYLKRFISGFSDYGLVLRVSKDYSIEIYDRHDFVYSTR